ncbi:MAG: hypothetical protein EXR77_15095 [Myxococcales bacterium]|nr:hypothetical protein [Myxococcales bacterium]
MATEQRQCPRCKTWNARARSNCSKCGAVMLGVAAVDIEEFVKDRGAGFSMDLPAQSASSGKDLQQTIGRLRQQRAAAQQSGAATGAAANAGCAGCLGKLAMLALIVVGGGFVFYEHNRDSPVAQVVDKTLAELTAEFEKLGKRKRAKFVRPYVPPRPVQPAWQVPPPPVPQPISAPDALAAEPAGFESDDPVKATSRATDMAAALNLRGSALMRCLRPDLATSDLQSGKARFVLRVTVGPMGLVSHLTVIEPTASAPRAMTCMLGVVRYLRVGADVAPTEFEFRWPVVRTR